MLKTKQLNLAFIITLGISFLVFVYLVFLGYEEIRTLKDVIKIVASILFPVPMLFFVRFILIENFIPENSEAYKLENQKPATGLFIITLLSILGVLKFLEYVAHFNLENHLILAHLINSTTISSYVLNYILYNNLKANGVLSGILMALAVHIFF
ncbi:MAG: hypothetical protein KDD16_05830 [Mangrovimonas sp.]|nr:hypothetical protein [Mangrovimonas sp.]MCB0435886.1 hypothetical protein [Mangrovimonas sp.]MCB0464772.1 hypothetical protein [Aequorivita sp.]